MKNIEDINPNDERFISFLKALIDAENSLFNSKISPRFHVNDFSYADALNGFSLPLNGGNGAMDSNISFFRGAVRPDSNNLLLNIHPTPDAEAVAMASLSLFHNIDGFMDEYSGEALLVEQKIIRELGKWAGWSGASGTATAGGKMTNLHAIRVALARCFSNYTKTGIPPKTIVIASEGTHYSLKYAVSALGLGTDNCWFVPMNASKSLDCNAFRTTLKRAWKEGYNVAAIVCCGGSTIHFHCDDLNAVYDTVIESRKEFPNAIMPYLHVDSVIGWQYLTLASSDRYDFEGMGASDETITRINEVNRRLRGIDKFDSFAADFHKNGLCPTSSSFFVSKSNSFMWQLSVENNEDRFPNMSLGQHRPYRYTMENSRSMHGIAAAWAILNKYGRCGIAKYLIEMHTSRSNFENAIENSELMSLDSHTSLGWEVIFKTKYITDDEKDFRKFIGYCNNLIKNGANIPLIGLFPDRDVDKLLIFPMRYYSSEDAKSIILSIESIWKEYQDAKLTIEIESPYLQSDPVK